MSEGGQVAGQAGVRPQGARRRARVGSPVAALVLVALVLVLAVVTVPLAGLAHRSLSASNGTVWVATAGAVVGFVLAWRRPGNPLCWIILSGAAFLALSVTSAAPLLVVRVSPKSPRTARPGASQRGSQGGRLMAPESGRPV